MIAIETIRTVLSFGDHNIRHIEDMRDSPVTAPSQHGGNHPLWILGQDLAEHDEVLKAPFAESIVPHEDRKGLEMANSFVEP